DERGGGKAPAAQGLALARDGRELHLAAAATPLQRDDGTFEGAVLVFDDVTPLIRTQRVAAWRAVVEECTSTIVGEVESLKELVDEFAQFARMPAPRAVPSDLNAVLADTLLLYKGLFNGIRIEQRFADALPPVRVDIEQFRRVVINLVDNAVEALGGN